jgi:hypothetical protein
VSERTLGLTANPGEQMFAIAPIVAGALGQLPVAALSPGAGFLLRSRRDAKAAISR